MTWLQVAIIGTIAPFVLAAVVTVEGKIVQ